MTHARLPAAADMLSLRYGQRLATALLAVFAILLLGAFVFADEHSVAPAAMAAFYRTGALVFGGGHVVLPLLEESLVQPGLITAQEFLSGYGAAQALPGPLFALGAYLGVLLPGGSGGVVGGLSAVLMIFLPGLLLVAGTLPYWHGMSRRPSATRAIAGINAAVVGLLIAALYDPVWTSGIGSVADIAIALVGFAMLWRVPVVWTLVWCVSASALSDLLL